MQALEVIRRQASARGDILRADIAAAPPNLRPAVELERKLADELCSRASGLQVRHEALADKVTKLGRLIGATETPELRQALGVELQASRAALENVKLEIENFLAQQSGEVVQLRRA